MAALQKVALVTGAGTGIGKAVALALMKEGYQSESGVAPERPEVGVWGTLSPALVSVRATYHASSDS